MACIKDSIAHCANSTWKLEACPKTLSCFALPSVREEGTVSSTHTMLSHTVLTRPQVISCTSNATALAVINASGATGGIAANSTKNSVDLPTDCDGDDESDDDNSTQGASTASETASATSTHSSKSSNTASASDSDSATAPSSTSSGKSGSGKDSQVTVTITAVPTVTLPSETFTLDPSAASSLISSLATEPGVSITTIRPSAPTTSSASANATEGTPAASSKPKVTASPSSSVPAISVGPPLTITLLGQPAVPASTTASASSADGYSY